MMVTSKVKMRNATEVLIDFAGAIQETVTFGRQQNIIHENLVRTERFLEDLGAPTETGPERPRSGGRVHKLGRRKALVRGSRLEDHLVHEGLRNA